MKNIRSLILWYSRDIFLISETSVKLLTRISGRNLVTPLRTADQGHVDVNT